MPYSRESGYLQNIVDDGITFNDIGRDAVEKLRVSNPQSLIDTDFEYSLQASKWEFLTLANNFPGVYSRANEPAFTSDQIVSLTPSGPGDRNLTVTVNILPNTPFQVGDSIVIKESANTTFVDGAYIIIQVPSAYSFVVTTKSPEALVGDQKTAYTAIYTGGFYSNSNIPIVGISAVAATSAAVIEFANPHGLFITSPIIVVDSNQANVPWCGSFSVSAVPNDYQVIYQTLTGQNYTTNTLLVPSSGRVYAKTEGVAVHRFFDGGIQINPGTSAPNSRTMRQTRNYFKYQSGKSMQFSSGVLFRPVYEVSNVQLITNNQNNSTYPYYDFRISTEQYHGFAIPDAYRKGVSITTAGFTVSGGTNPYNRVFQVSKVVNSKTFEVQIPVNTVFNPFPTGDFNPGGIGSVEVNGWNDATVRSGLFDDQNGMFFEFDGQTFFAVKRQTTTPLAGTIQVKQDSPWMVSSDNNTKFLTQIKENDFVNIKGMSYQINSIFNNLSATFSPTYRGPNTSGIKVVKTEELRIPQSEFNLDRLDGTGPSGYVLNINRMQMIFIDYSWYGAGKIRYGIRANKGKIIYFHEIYNNNVNVKAHMRSGNLPGRFEISSNSKAGTLVAGNLQTNSTTLSVNKDFGDYLPTKGRIIVNNEYIKYTKGNTLPDSANAVELSLDQRNTGGLVSGNQTAVVGDGVLSFNQNCSPSLSHWGVAALMDGFFNEDRSYLFTAFNSTVLSATSAEHALLSVRLAPSVDYGIPGPLGVRNVVNHTALKLQSVGIVTNNPIQVFVRVNAEPQTVFKNLSAWQSAPNGSIAQYFDHTKSGSFEMEGSGGDLIASFFATPDIQNNGFNNPRYVSDSFNIEIVRLLTNSILGGDFVFPDGPDVVTVSVKTFGSPEDLNNNYTATTRARMSRTEDQG